MIKYALHCDQGHGFESWFASSQSFASQAKRGLVNCPVCGSVRVEKQIMAPNLGSSAPGADVSEAAPVQDQSVALLSEPMQELRARLRELHAEIKAHTEDVGTGFAEEARKIHYGEREERAIRGQATRDEAMDLQAEGIAFLPVPPLPDERN